jgi:hypothetical protein
VRPSLPLRRGEERQRDGEASPFFCSCSSSITVRSTSQSATKASRSCPVAWVIKKTTRSALEHYNIVSDGDLRKAAVG